VKKAHPQIRFFPAAVVVAALIATIFVAVTSPIGTAPSVFF